MEEEEYFRSIEEYFLQKRGDPFLLSPKEWTLIREWFETQIPYEIVLRAIDVGFEKKKEDHPLTLTYFRRIVKAEYKRHLKSLEGTAEPSPSSGLDAGSIKNFLERLIRDLSTSSEKASQGGNVALAEILLQIREKLNIHVPSFLEHPSDLQRVEHHLSILEKEIETVLLQTIPEQQMKTWKEDAMRELKSFEQKVDLPVYQEMMNRAVIKSVRKLYEIPRLSIFYM